MGFRSPSAENGAIGPEPSWKSNSTTGKQLMPASRWCPPDAGSVLSASLEDQFEPVAHAPAKNGLAETLREHMLGCCSHRFALVGSTRLQLLDCVDCALHV